MTDREYAEALRRGLTATDHRASADRYRRARQYALQARTNALIIDRNLKGADQ